MDGRVPNRAQDQFCIYLFIKLMLDIMLGDKACRHGFQI